MKVATLWRYPVKSMLGERCEALEIEARGVRGDRAFAVRDAAGKLGSGKDTRRMRRLEGLFSHAARGEGDSLAVCLPDGRWVPGNSFSIDEELSRSLGAAVRLSPEAEVQHFDASPIHVLTTASLAWLRARLPASAIDERRFRPNLVVEAPGAEPLEQAWIGRTLRVGRHAVLKVVAPCERCGMTTLAQGELPFDPLVLRCLAQEAGELFGVYAEVVRPGPVALGQAVVVD